MKNRQRYIPVQLAQVLVGKPFFEGQNERMNQEEKDFAESWINEHILFQDYQDGGMPTIESILEKGASAVMRYGGQDSSDRPIQFYTDRPQRIRDRYGFRHAYKGTIIASNTMYVASLLLIPTKPAERGKKQIVTGVDVAKSMAWFSKADMGLTVFEETVV